MTGDHKVGAVALIVALLIVIVVTYGIVQHTERASDNARRVEIAEVRACRHADNVDACIISVSH